MTPDPLIQQKLNYTFEYPVAFTEDVFDPENPLLARTLDRLDENRVHRAMVFIDSNVADLLPQITQHIIQYFEAYSDDIELAEEPRVIPGGEIIKNDIEVVGPLISAMVDAHLCRHSFVIIIGGGAVLDTVGFAAALAHRGIRTVRIPTTLFAQINAGVGVKTGINFDGHKNCAGAFSPPFAVINDWQFLYSLPEREWLGGVAEAFRLALLLDPEFLDDLCTLAPTLCQRRSEDIQHVVQRSASLCLSQIASQSDPFESVPGNTLDFGRWSAHKLEMLSNCEISHGEAIAVAVLLDCLYSVEQGWFPESDFDRLCTAFAQLGLPFWFAEMDLVGEDGNPEIFHGIPDFQEHKGGMLCIPFPSGIGSSRVEHIVDLAVMEQALQRLKALASSGVELHSR